MKQLLMLSNVKVISLNVFNTSALVLTVHIMWTFYIAETATL